jgi:hypothetical protein
MVTNKQIAVQANARVEEIRLALRDHPECWIDVTGMNGVAERWLRAFAGGQIKQPPANRFLAIERFLSDRRLVTRR